MLPEGITPIGAGAASAEGGLISPAELAAETAAAPHSTLISKPALISKASKSALVSESAKTTLIPEAAKPALISETAKSPLVPETALIIHRKLRPDRLRGLQRECCHRQHRDPPKNHGGNRAFPRLSPRGSDSRGSFDFR